MKKERYYDDLKTKKYFKNYHKIMIHYFGIKT